MFEKFLEFTLEIIASIAVFVGGFLAITPNSVPLPENENTLATSSEVSAQVRELPAFASTTQKSTSPQNEGVIPVVPKKVAITPKVSQVPISPPRGEQTAPGPLLADEFAIVEFQKQGLDVDEIITLTNQQRIAQGLISLKKRDRLGAMAEAKTVDMITKQYFAHVSPLGVDIGDLAQTYGYQYHHVGENLALGDFASSSHVVDGWMNSPGHRANILGKDYTEIGVAVMRGQWEGREVWWAVQEFGKPLPDCVTPETLLEEKIKIFETQLTTLKGTLDRALAELSTDMTEANYRVKVEEYNLLVDLFNSMLVQQKSMITTYNEEVRSYNMCISP